MRIKFFAPRWGAEEIAWEPFLQKVKEAGYAGIEWFPFGEESGEEQHLEVVSLLKKYGLEFSIVTAVLQHYPDVNEYVEELERQLRYLCRLKPLFISAQTGREFYSMDDIGKTLRCCKTVSEENGIPIYQETHRNKWSFAAHAVRQVLDLHDDFHLTFDISHWFCVSESYLHDQQETVEKAISRARHIHARVGHTEGPQVYDPALPEYREALDEHLRIWDKYIDQRKAGGAEFCTITPEFGPPPYMVFANKSGSPHDEQWRINLWMKDHLQQRYSTL